MHGVSGRKDLLWNILMTRESAVLDVSVVSSKSTKGRYTLGVISLILVVIGWVGTNFLIGVICSLYLKSVLIVL